MTSSPWLDGGKIVRTDENKIVFCTNCPCCVSPRESQMAWTTASISYSVDICLPLEPYDGIHPVPFETYTGTVSHSWTRDTVVGTDKFILLEYNCCPCRWKAFTEAGEGLQFDSADTIVHKTFDADAVELTSEDVDISGTQIFITGSDLGQCKASSVASETPPTITFAPAYANLVESDFTDHLVRINTSDLSDPFNVIQVNVPPSGAQKDLVATLCEPSAFNASFELNYFGDVQPVAIQFKRLVNMTINIS